MRTLYLAALLGSSALAPPALAQTPAQPTQTQPQAQQEQPAACDRLVQHLEQRGAATGPVSLEQAREFQSQNNQRRCEESLRQLRTAQQGGQPDQRAGAQQGMDRQTEFTVQQQAPVISMDRAPPQVTVHQPQPQVTVRQPQPEIIVNQPAPTITVQQPQPTITVRMPEPQVNVQMPQPRVEVNVPQPQVSVLPAEREPQVQAEPVRPRITVVPAGEVQPTVQRHAGRPVVRFEDTGEPKINYQRAEGQPRINFERAGEARKQAQAQPQEELRGRQPAAQPQAQQPQQQRQTAQQPAQAEGRPITASRLLDMGLYNARGEQIGDVEKLILGRDNRQYIVIGHGGFLGLGEKQIVLSLDNVRLVGDRLLTRNLTDEQIRAVPEWNWPEGTYQELRGETPINLL